MVAGLRYEIDEFDRLCYLAHQSLNVASSGGQNKTDRLLVVIRRINQSRLARRRKQSKSRREG
jgi:hypothetical protein